MQPYATHAPLQNAFRTHTRIGATVLETLTKVGILQKRHIFNRSFKSVWLLTDRTKNLNIYTTLHNRSLIQFLAWDFGQVFKPSSPCDTKNK